MDNMTTTRPSPGIRTRPQSMPPGASISDNQRQGEGPVMHDMSQTSAHVIRQRISTTSGHGNSSDISSRVSGKEILGDHPFLVEDSIALWSSSQDSIPIRNRVWSDLSNRQLPHELPELIIRRLEKSDGMKIPRIQRSYINGLLYKELLEWAVRYDPAAELG